MPVESITCDKCGSGETKEVKPNTYFCLHCESTFKYVDPTRITVTQEQAYCECGNPVAFQCYQCRTGICTRHDVYDDGNKVSPAEAGFVQQELNTRPPHLCMDCFEPIRDKLRQLKAESRLCSDDSCLAEPETRCGCCRTATCSAHAKQRELVLTWGPNAEESLRQHTAKPVCDRCGGRLTDALRSLKPYIPSSRSKRATATLRSTAEADASRIMSRLTSELNA